MKKPLSGEVQYLLNLVTEHPEGSTSTALLTWKSVLFPSIAFLFLLQDFSSTWTPFIAAVLVLAFVQRNVTRFLIDNLITRNMKDMKDVANPWNAAKNPSRGVAALLGGILLAYIIGLGILFTFVVPGVCEIQGWANVKFLSKKVCASATNGLNQFLQENSGGNQH